MRLTVFGASGQTGVCLVAQALQLGHSVTAFVRNPASIATRHENLDVVGGNVGDADAIGRVINGRDVVLLALGVKMGVSDQVCTIATANVVPAMQELGVRRLINIGGMGTGTARDQLSAFGKLVAGGLRMLDRHAFRDKESQDVLIRNSGLDWINVCPPWLTNGPLTGVYRVGTELRPPVTAKISRADVADFMLKQVIDATFVGKNPILYY
jgi:putative NADH-flavin reductase